MGDTHPLANIEDVQIANDDVVQVPQNNFCERLSSGSTIGTSKKTADEALANRLLSSGTEEPAANRGPSKYSMSAADCRTVELSVEDNENCKSTVESIPAHRYGKMYNLFLQLNPRWLHATDELDAFKRSDFNLTAGILITVMGSVFWVLRGNIFGSVFLRLTYLFLMSTLCGIISFLAVQLVIMTAILTQYDNKDTGYLCESLKSILVTFQRYKLLENITLIFGTLATLLQLLARVSAGPCSEGISAWEAQECNPFYEMRELPTEQLVLSLIVVLALQVVAKGASHVSIIVAWMLCIALTNTALYLCGSDLVVLTNVAIGMLMVISYEFERSTISHFIHEEVAVEAVRRVRDLELALANERIINSEQDLAAKRSMVRHISHEMRTPLNTAYLGAEVLEHSLGQLGDIVPRDALDVVGDIRSACESALVIVNEFLNFDKIAAGLMSIEKSIGNVLSLTKDTIKEFAMQANAKEISLVLSIGDKVDLNNSMIFVDFMKVGLVIRNLLSNALKFTPRNGVVKVIVDTELVSSDFEHDFDVIITVKDTGAGLSGNDIGNLFKEGVQFNANTLQDGGGSGYGLFIAKGIIDLHKGAKIWAASVGEGFGSEFSIKFPLVRACDVQKYNSCLEEKRSEKCDRAEVKVSKVAFSSQKISTETTDMDSFYGSGSAHESVPGNILSEDVHCKSLCVLVADDSAPSRKMVGRMLKLQGHTYVFAVDGWDAVREVSHMMSRLNVRTNADNARVNSTCDGTSGINMDACSGSVSTGGPNTVFDAILMDCEMPRLGGLAAAAKIRALGYKGPIIGLTGIHDVEGFLSAGADLVLLKPVDVETLRNALCKAVKKTQTFECPKFCFDASNIVR